MILYLLVRRWPLLVLVLDLLVLAMDLYEQRIHKLIIVWQVILAGIILCGFVRKSLLFLLVELNIAF